MVYSTTPGTRGICPSGWHIPTKAEYQTLGISADSSANALKAIGQGSGSGLGINTSGFTGLLAGLHSVYGTYGSLGSEAYIWSSLQNTQYATYLALSASNNTFHLYTYAKNYSLSVRCIKD